MEATIEELIAGANPTALFAQVSSLDAYPAWMRLVHRVEPLPPDDGRAAWWVELRARVGPFARSKQLRMVRTVYEPDVRARFERIQPDDREHAAWVLDARVVDASDAADPTDGAGAGSCRLTMQLGYTGDLWSAGVLGRILDDEVRRGTEALSAMFSSPAGPTR
jgi:Polyketide cyclase / dehydrase and lipid transport